MNAAPARGLISLILIFCCSAGFAQQDESLDVIAGDDESRLAGQPFRTVVELVSEDQPVEGERLYLSTTFGQLAASQFITDEKGHATIIVNSDSEGTGEVTVRTSFGTTLQYPIKFIEPTTSQLQLSASVSRVYSPGNIDINVRLIDENLDVVPGRSIALSVSDPAQGVLDETGVDTDADGEASTNLTISAGLAPGTEITITGNVASEPDINAALTIQVVADGGDRIRIVRPGNNTRVELNVAQTIEAIWRRADVPVVNQKITFSTSHGDLVEDTAFTDAAGIARTTISATEVGVAGLKAGNNGTISNPVTINFGGIDPTSNQYRTGSQSVPLQIFYDRIGIQARRGVSGNDVQKIALKENFNILRTLNSQLYEFELPSELSREMLHALARRLEGQYSDKVRKAGLIVQRVGGTRPALMSSIIRVRFVNTLDDAAIALLKNDFPIDDIRLATGSTRYYDIRLTEASAWNILVIADQIRMQSTAPVRFSYPLFTMAVEPRALCTPGTTIIDPRFKDQWHHDNPGVGAATPDADIDSVEAWNFNKIDISYPLVGVIDTSFSVDHCEFVDGPANKDNLWTGTDLMGNTIRGRDFADGLDDLLVDPPLYSDHGTAVGGILGSIEGNNWGGRGVCFDCTMLFMTRQDQDDARAGFEFAIDEGARIINNSWALDTNLPPVDLNDIIAEAALIEDIVVLFAASNFIENECASTTDIQNGNVTDMSAFPHVISVSASTDEDLRRASGIGDCVNVLGPTNGGENGVTTVDIKPGTSGYINSITDAFGGTSAATPMVAGIAGLMLGHDASLSHDQVRQILQDTADKIDPHNANYDVETGYSAFSAQTPNYAFGRVNAFEAVALVAAYDPAETDLMKRGKGGKDLLLRDHPFDWGNTEQPSNVLFTYPRHQTEVWPGTDIKLDAMLFQTVTPDLAGFLSLQSELPEIGVRTRVYVRVRNRGPYNVSDAVLKVNWTLQSNPLPPLPADFWSSFPQDSAIANSGWTSAGRANLADIPYSGASAAGCPGRSAPLCMPFQNPQSDLAEVALFSIPALDWDPSTKEQLSLFVAIHSEEDPVLAKTGVVVPDDLFDVLVAANMDNNVTFWQGTSIETGCEGLTITIIKIIVIVLVILTVVIIYARFMGIKIPVGFYVLWILLLIPVFIIVIRLPGCAIEALETLGLSMN